MHCVFVILLSTLRLSHLLRSSSLFCFFFFNDTATTEIYTLSLHDALPIYHPGLRAAGAVARSQDGNGRRVHHPRPAARLRRDRKSTRLNSSHSQISYAVFCLKKKKEKAEQKRDTRVTVV